jgi:endonuclease/exonuclease/phosphatase family metal-dependent hydrolase
MSQKKFLVASLFFLSSIVWADRFTVMTYNVENLFDTVHDEGKDDYTYLPLEVKRGALKRQVEKSCNASTGARKKECLNLDWNEEMLGTKMRQMASVIRSVSTDRGVGPDVLFLQEVENFNVFQSFVESQFPDAGYYGVLFEAKDPRGIDSALLSRFPISERRPPQLHDIDMPSGSQLARGILEVTVDLPDGTPMTTLVFHFPAPYNPRAKREAALHRLNEILQDIPATHLVVAGGDSNVTSQEELEHGLIQSISRPFWHMIEDFCQGCLGTNYYAPKHEWSFLDRLMVSQGRSGRRSTLNWQIDGASARVVNTAPGQVDERGFPIRFDPEASSETERGMSDHLPLAFDFIN